MKAYTGTFLAKLLTLIFASIPGFAQVNYSFTASSGTFTELDGAIPITFNNTNNGLSSPINFGFLFTYFGEDHNQLVASTNGLLILDVTTNSSQSVNNMINPSLPLIAPLWDDLKSDVGAASYAVEGALGNRILTVQFLNWQLPALADEANISFQVKLYEVNDRIEFIYRQEAGDMHTASCSIGIVGPHEDQIYSLADASGSPVLHPTGYNLINARPATGQVYAFTPGVLTPVAPTSQPVVSIAALEARSMTLSWTGGNGANTVVFMKQTPSVSEAFPVSNGNRYLSSSVFGSAPAGLDWYCVYNGSGSTVSVSDLDPGLEYRIQAFEYNGLGGSQVYLTTTSADNSLNVITHLVPPTGSPSSIEVSYVGMQSLTIEVDEGDGTKRAVFVKTGSSGVPAVADNTTYLPNELFGAGSEIGTSGWFCVANSESLSSVNITGLSPGENYVLAVVDYNGAAGSEVYMVTVANLHVETYHDENIDYTFAKATQPFIGLSGGTRISEIEVDEGLSPTIPIGFSFEIEGQSFSGVVVSSNGFLSFNPYVTETWSTGNMNDLTSSNFNPVVAPLWDDLSGEEGRASFKTEGVSGRRVFTVEFKDWKWDADVAESTISFQVRLYETTNKIEFIYKREAAPVAFGLASIGVAFINKGNFLSLSSAASSATASSVVETSNISEKPESGQVFKFLPPKLDQTIAFNGLVTVQAGTVSQLAIQASSGLPVGLESSDPAIAEIGADSEVIAHGVGTVTITAFQTGDESYHQAASVQQFLTVIKGDQEITLDSIGELTIGDELELSAISSSGLPVSYQSSNDEIAMVSGNKLIAVRAGTCTITASQTGNVNFNSISIERTLTVVKANQTLDFTLGDNAFKTYGDENFILDATASSGLSVTYTSSNEQVASVEGNVVEIIAPGETDITAMQAGDATYKIVESSRTLTVRKADQVISFEAVASPKKTGEVFDLVASSTAGLPVSFSTDDNELVSINESTVTALASGTATIVVSQSGNDFYNAAEDREITFQIRKHQVISFAEIGDKEIGDEDFVLSATATSGLVVTFHAVSDNISIKDGSIVSMLSAGEATIRGEQTGNEEWSPADAADFTFCVAPSKPEITAENTTGDFPVLQSNLTTGNQWLLNGVEISGATAQTLVTTEIGSYAVKTEIGGCESKPSDEYVLSVTGIEGPGSVFGMYPNPVGDRFIVNLSELNLYKPARVTFIDLSGRILNEWSGTDVMSCDISMHKAGHYLVKVDAGSRTFVKKIVKK